MTFSYRATSADRDLPELRQVHAREYGHAERYIQTVTGQAGNIGSEQAVEDTQRHRGDQRSQNRSEAAENDRGEQADGEGVSSEMSTATVGASIAPAIPASRPPITKTDVVMSATRIPSAAAMPRSDETALILEPYLVWKTSAHRPIAAIVATRIKNTLYLLIGTPAMLMVPNRMDGACPVSALVPQISSQTPCTRTSRAKDSIRPARWSCLLYVLINTTRSAATLMPATIAP